MCWKVAATGFAATTATFSPTTINAGVGQTFTVNVSLNPNGVQNYAEKLEVTYPASQLEVRSFTFASNWMNLAQPEYDSIDNINGVMIKSAGYPGGFSSQTAYGTITFAVKRTGTAVIKVGNTSQAFEISSQSAITGNQVSVNSGAASVSPTTPTSPSSNTGSAVIRPTTPGTSVSTDTSTDVTTPESTDRTEVSVSSSTDQTAAAVASGFPMKWVWMILGLAAILGAGYYFFLRKKTL